MSDRLKELFDAQARLLSKTRPIELKNVPTLYDQVPIDIDDRFGQLRIKELAWRITEEITETLTAAIAVGSFNSDIVREEIADVFHFFVELYLWLGWNERSFDTEPYREGEDRLTFLYRLSPFNDPKPGEPSAAWLAVIISLGMWMNTLKNRPWKTVLRPTNTDDFNRLGTLAMFELILACRASGLGPTDLYEAYMRKNEINHKRLESV